MDLDNLLKSVLDGLKGSAYEDYSQIDEVSARRYNISESHLLAAPKPQDVRLLKPGEDLVIIEVNHI